MFSYKFSLSQKFLLLIFCLVTVYWVFSQLHAYYCAPYGIWGYLWTPVLMGSPPCSALVKIISNTIEIYCSIWVCSVGFLISSAWEFGRSIGFLNNTFKTDEFNTSNDNPNDDSNEETRPTRKSRRR